MEKQKRVIYILGAMEHQPEYWKSFERAEDDLTALGYIPLSPARLPEGLSNEQRLKTHLAMLDNADAVLILPGYFYDKCAGLEKAYCDFIGKPCEFSPSLLSRFFEEVEQ